MTPAAGWSTTVCKIYIVDTSDKMFENSDLRILQFVFLSILEIVFFEVIIVLKI